MVESARLKRTVTVVSGLRSVSVGSLVRMILFGVVILHSQVADACPFCLTPPQTWAEKLHDSDIIVVAELIDVRTWDFENRVESRFRIKELRKSPHSSVQSGSLQAGGVMTLEQFVEGQTGDTYLLTGCLKEMDTGPVATFAAYEETDDPFRTVSQTTMTVDVSAESSSNSGPPLLYLIPHLFDWDPPEPMTGTALQYILSAPSAALPQRLRLPYYVSFLEHSAGPIASDAWGEFARSEYADVKFVANHFSRRQLRSWIADRETFPERLGLYGMMLGLCGDQSDAAFLLEQTRQPDDEEFRFGIEGLLGGYLLLQGADGLLHLADTRIDLRSSGTDELMSFCAGDAFHLGLRTRLCRTGTAQANDATVAPARRTAGDRRAGPRTLAGLGGNLRVD
jgi:hypothetical protein